MNTSQRYSPLPSIHADDDEIRHYSKLLDSLGIGLMVFSINASVCLKNERARELFGDMLPNWLDENGQLLEIDRHPLNIALRTSQADNQRVMILANGKAERLWLSVNAIPVLSEQDKPRLILLTMTDISEQRNLREEVELLSVHDSLTGVFNREHVLHLLEKEIHRARRYGTPFTMARLDVDDFSALCTEYGSQTEEMMLSQLGSLFSKCMREIDITGRIGKSQFLLILPNVAMKNAMIGLERLRVQVESQIFTEAELRLTISGGITEYTGESSETLVERCKALMLNAREAGGNRFCLDLDII